MIRWRRKPRPAEPLASPVGSMALLGALGLVLAPHLWRLPLWLGALGLLYYLWRWLLQLRELPMPPRWLRILLAFVTLAAVAYAFRSIAGREAGVALLSLMLSLKLLEMKSQRDAMVSLFIGYFLLAAGFLFDQSIAAGVYLFAVLLLLTAALIALNHPLASWRRGRDYLRIGGALLLQAVPMMLVLFLLFPRFDGPLWYMPERSKTGLTGLDDTLFMGAVSELVDSEEPAFHVHFTGEPPPPPLLYWRGPVLWHTDGQLWQPLDEWQRLPRSGERIRYEAVGEAVRYRVVLEPHGRHWLFALDLPASLPEPLPVGGATLTTDYLLLSKQPVNQRLQYSLSSHTGYDTGMISRRELRWALLLPDEANPRSLRLARRWQAEGLGDRQLVERALSYFREQPFYYTRQPAIFTRNPVDGFLFESRRGFCEHYAASFVTLMRAAGVPARLVTGYQGGEFNPLDQSLLVRQSDAHAWAEVWLNDSGWTRVDPTAVIPPERVEDELDLGRFEATREGRLYDELNWLADSLHQLRLRWDALNNQWNTWVLGFDERRQRQFFDNLGLEDLPVERIALLIIPLLFVPLALVALYLYWRRPSSRDPLQRLWLRFCRKLERQGLVRRLDEGPLDYAERVAAERPGLAAEVQPIAELYARLRYAKSAPAEGLAELRRRVVAFHPGKPLHGSP